MTRSYPEAGTVIEALLRRDETVATAESLTAGMLCVALTEIPGSSAAVRGGLVVYATELKVTLAGVDRELLAGRGPVDPEVAVQLADGGRQRCGADWGVGLTGVAGPGAQDGIAQGTVYLGLSGPDVHTAVELLFSGGRTEVREAAVGAALASLREQLS